MTRRSVSPELTAMRGENRAARVSVAADPAMSTAAQSELRSTAEYAARDSAYRRTMGHWHSAARMTDYLAQHSAGSGAFQRLCRRDKAATVASMLERFVRAGLVDQAIGEGKRGRDCRKYT